MKKIMLYKSALSLSTKKSVYFSYTPRPSSGEDGESVRVVGQSWPEIEETDPPTLGGSAMMAQAQSAIRSVHMASAVVGRLPRPRAAVCALVFLAAAVAAPGALAVATPACSGTDSWSTYAHDARRSGASGGCVWFPLAAAWSYAPSAAPPRVMQTVERAIADTTAVYVKWDSSGNNAISWGTPAVDAVSLAGVRLWSADKPLNDNQGNWPSFFTYEKYRNGVYETRRGLVLNDDGLRIWNAAGGPVYRPPNPLPYADRETHSSDSWGETLTDGTRLWIYNQEVLHGPDMGLRAYDRRGKLLLSLNNYGYYDNPGHVPQLPQEQWDIAGDYRGALAYDGGAIYLGTRYQFACTPSATKPCDSDEQKPFKSGLYSWTTSAGEERWPMVEVDLASHMSVAGIRMYLLEKDPQNGQVTLAIRHGGYRGNLLFRSAPLSGLRHSAQPPVLAGGRVITAVEDSNGDTVVHSWDTFSGATPQSRRLAGVRGVAVSFPGLSKLNNAGGAPSRNSARSVASIAAAVGTRNDAGDAVPTLVITSSHGLHVLRVSDLAELWWASKAELVGAADAAQGGWLRDPAIVGKRVYVADQNKLYAFDAP